LSGDCHRFSWWSGRRFRADEYQAHHLTQSELHAMSNQAEVQIEADPRSSLVRRHLADSRFLREVNMPAPNRVADAVGAAAEYDGVLRVLRDASEHFQWALATNNRAKRYLAARGLAQASIERFGLGYAGAQRRNLSPLLPRHADVDVVASGLLVRVDGDAPGTRFDRFRDRITFPIRDLAGDVIAFGGRRLNDRRVDMPKYLNSPETALFDKGSTLYGLYEAQDAIRARDLVVVMEGYLDVISCAQAGCEACVSTLGTACSPAHLEQLFALTSRVVFCFDGDAAGRRAAERALQVALPWTSRDRTVTFVFLDPKHDPDSLVREHGLQALEAAVAHAMSALEFAIELARAGCDMCVAEDRARAAHFAGRYWAIAGADDLAHSLLRYFAGLLRITPAEMHDLWSNTHLR